MTIPRRCFQYSLRSFLVVLTAFAIWLGVIVNRAREQRETVKIIEAMGGELYYDWQSAGLDAVGNPIDLEPCGPAWLRRIVGNELFQTVDTVTFPYMPDSKQADILRMIPRLQRLRSLKRILVIGANSQDTIDKLTVALPNCEEISMSLPGF